MACGIVALWNLVKTTPHRLNETALFKATHLNKTYLANTFFKLVIFWCTIVGFKYGPSSCCWERGIQWAPNTKFYHNESNLMHFVAISGIWRLINL